MNATIQDTLLDLFQQVIEGPDSMPVVPIDAWREGSEEKRLHSMRERITNLGGTFEIESIAGSGTRICVRIPGLV